jgi:hypothetical protein
MAGSRTYAVATGRGTAKKGSKKLVSKAKYTPPRAQAAGMRRWGTKDGSMGELKPFGTGTRRRGTKSRTVDAEREVTYRSAGGRVKYVSSKKTGRVGRSGWTLAKANVRRDKRTGEFRSR